MQIIDLAQLSLSGSTQFTSTGTVFNDPLTEYTGTSTPGWTLESGSVSYSTNGVTATASGSTNSMVYNSGAKWSPISGAGAVTGQVTFTIPSTLPGGNNLKAQLLMDANNYYDIYHTSGNLTIDKVLNGVRSNLTSAAYASANLAGATVTLKVTLDPTGALSATLYSGTTTQGTQLVTTSKTDASPLTGPYAFAVGGGTNVVASGVIVTAPIPSPVNGPIAEEKILLWCADGTTTIGSSQTTANAAFLVDGSATMNNTGGTLSNLTSASKIFTLSSNWPSNLKYALEATMNDSSSSTCTVALFDITSSAQVTSSQVATTSATSTTVRSGQFTLIPGHTYAVTLWVAAGSGTITDASLIVFP